MLPIVFAMFCSAFSFGQTKQSHVADSLEITLNELNVVATKHNSGIFEQPESYTIIGAGEAQQLDVMGLKGLSGVAPNFFMPDYGSRITSSIYVRGIGARMDQPSVGLNVDNVPFLNKDAYDFDITDISSIEFLRGPQSTLFGRNTMAGLINITTLSPMVYQGWRLSAEAGSLMNIKLSAGWYHKLSEKSALAVSASWLKARGSFKNEYNGTYLDHENNLGARLKFIWAPSREFTLQNTFSTGYLRQGGYPYEYIKTGKIEYNDTCFYKRFTLSDGVSVSYDKGSYKITSVTSLQHINDNMTLDQDFLPLDYFVLTQKKNEIALTEDLIVNGIKGAGKYKWLAGLFGFYKHLSMTAPVTFKDVGIRELIEKNRNNANPTYPIEWDSRSFALNSDFTIPTFGFAAYHQSDLMFSNWKVTLGLRFDYEKASLDYTSHCNTGYEILHLEDGIYKPFSHIDLNIHDTGRISRDFFTFLPKVALTYIIEENKGVIYAKFTRGYKAGGFNTQMFSDVLQQRLMGIMGVGAQYKVEDIVSYKPEQSWNYEVGFHLPLETLRLRIDGSLFYIDCRDQQLTMFPDGTTTGRIMTNAGKTRSFGGELSINFRLNEKIEFNGSYGYTNARFRKFHNGIEDFKGKYLPYVPSNTLFLQALYGIGWSDNDTHMLIFDLNMRGAGRIFWNEQNSIQQNFYALLGACVTLKIPKWEFELWGKNLTDTKYHTFYFLSMGNEFLQRGKGMELGVSVRFVL